MHLHAADLRAFYYRTRLGRAAQSALRNAARAIWPDVRGQNIGGYGFAAPFLRSYLDEAERVISLMPAQQGAMPWPPEGPNRCVLAAERAWPISAGFFDRILIAHGLETSERPDALLDEVIRCLAPGGRVIVIAPNRSGLWARSDATPFGYGRPYSRRQLEAQLGRHGLAPLRARAALFALPSHKRFWLRAAPMMERIGGRWAPDRLGGVLIVEAEKRTLARPRGGAPVAAQEPLAALEGLIGPRPAGARS